MVHFIVGRSLLYIDDDWIDLNEEVEESIKRHEQI